MGCSGEGSAVVVCVCMRTVLCLVVKYTAPSGTRSRCLVVGAGMRCASPPRTPQRGMVRGPGCCQGTRREGLVHANGNAHVLHGRLVLMLM